MDVGGVEIGSAFSAAKPLMMKANAGYQITDMTQGGKLAGYNAVFQKDGKPVDQLVVLQNAAGVVWFVARGQSLAQGERMKQATLLSSLRAKYGAESGISIGTGGPFWQFDRAGSVYKGEATKSPCAGPMVGAGSTVSVGVVPGASLNVPKNFPSKCGAIVDVPIHTDKDGMVASFSIQLVDSKRRYDELSAKDAAGKTEDQRKLEAERARDVKPKL